MNWLKRMTDRRPAPVLPHAAFAGTIGHHAWHNGNRVTHLWKNPDPHSSVAGICIEIIGGASPGLCIGLAGKADRPVEDVNAALKDCGLGGGAYVGGVNREEFTKGGIANPHEYLHTLMLHFGFHEGEAQKAHTVTQGRRIMTAFRDSDLISCDPSLREALVNDIAKTLGTMRLFEPEPAAPPLARN